MLENIKSIHMPGKQMQGPFIWSKPCGLNFLSEWSDGKWWFTGGVIFQTLKASAIQDGILRYERTLSLWKISGIEICSLYYKK